MNATLDVACSGAIVFFTFDGFDESDEVNGSGSAELLEDGPLETEIAFHLGDDAVLRAERESSSAASLLGLVDKPDPVSDCRDLDEAEAIGGQFVAPDGNAACLRRLKKHSMRFRRA